MQRAWVVRPYPHGVYRMRDFLSMSLVAIGWPDTGNLESCTTRASLGEAVDQSYPSSARSKGQTVGIIDRFVNVMKKDDYVLVPDGPVVYFGEVDSGYKFAVDFERDGFAHQRAVKWLHGKRAVSRVLMPGKLFDSLKGRQTVFETPIAEVKQILASTHLFGKANYSDLKTQYLEKLQKGSLLNVNCSTFENAVRDLFMLYFPGLQRLSTRSSKEGDTDLSVTLPGRITIRIQVKYFYPELGEIAPWVVEQLANSMQPGDNGIVLTSGVVGQAARAKADEYESFQITFVDGQEFVDILFENMDKIPEASLNVFGLRRDVDWL